MICRVYVYTDKYPTYIDCSVCTDWLEFQNFAKWFSENYIEGYQLDKDILKKGNKIYAPEFCVFIPQEINKLFNDSKNQGSKTPQGVDAIFNPVLRYKVTISKYAKRHYLGCFDNLDTAKSVYKKEKESYVKQVAEEHFNLGNISLETFKALLVWEL